MEGAEVNGMISFDVPMERPFSVVWKDTHYNVKDDDPLFLQDGTKGTLPAHVFGDFETTPIVSVVLKGTGTRLRFAVQHNASRIVVQLKEAHDGDILRWAMFPRDFAVLKRDPVPQKTTVSLVEVVIQFDELWQEPKMHQNVDVLAPRDALFTFLLTGAYKQMTLDLPSPRINAHTLLFYQQLQHDCTDFITEDALVFGLVYLTRFLVAGATSVIPQPVLPKLTARNVATALLHNARRRHLLRYTAFDIQDPRDAGLRRTVFPNLVDIQKHGLCSEGMVEGRELDADECVYSAPWEQLPAAFLENATSHFFRVVRGRVYFWRGQLHLYLAAQMLDPRSALSRKMAGILADVCEALSLQGRDWLSDPLLFPAPTDKFTRTFQLLTGTCFANGHGGGGGIRFKTSEMQKRMETAIDVVMQQCGISVGSYRLVLPTKQSDTHVVLVARGFRGCISPVCRAQHHIHTRGDHLYFKAYIHARGEVTVIRARSVAGRTHHLNAGLVATIVVPADMELDEITTEF